MLYRDILEYETKTNERRDITQDVQAVIAKCGIVEGLCNVFVQGTTAALLLNEDDRMLMADIEKMLSALAPEGKLYQHPENAASHLRSIVLRNSIDVPIAEGKLLLGQWQSIMLWEFDIKERKRSIIVTIMGG